MLPLKNMPAVDVDVRLMPRRRGRRWTALPKASSTCTVIVPEATPAVSVCAAW